MRHTILLLFLLLTLNACVEVKDPEQAGPPKPTPQEPAEKPVVVTQATQLIVDQPLYLFEGEVLTAAQFAQKGRLPKVDIFAYKYDYLVIDEWAVLYTLGQSVWLEVGELRSQEGRIETFPEGTTALPETAGRDGGDLNFTFHHAEGILKIILRGEKGGKGANGPEPDASLNGADGEMLTKCNGDAVAEDRWMGKPGLPGYDGKQGAAGGGSGSLRFTVHNHSNFQPLFKKTPGAGGDPGIGNKRGGQPGGYGPVRLGYGECIDYVRLVGKQPIGPLRVGGPGKDGARGPDGSVGVIHVNDKGNQYPL